MEISDSIKNRLISKILASKNERFLEAIENLFLSSQQDEVINFSPSQKEMINMGLDDIEKGNVITESEIDNFDNEWKS